MRTRMDRRDEDERDWLDAIDDGEPAERPTVRAIYLDARWIAMLAPPVRDAV